MKTRIKSQKIKHFEINPIDSKFMSLKTWGLNYYKTS